MVRTNVVVVRTLALVGIATAVACSSSSGDGTAASIVGETNPTCGADCDGASSGGSSSGGSSSGGGDAGSGGGINGVKDGSETDVDCGGPNAPKCAEGKSCNADSDCAIACSDAKKCIMAPSCKPHLGGDTCGEGEVEEGGVGHESCCRSLPVPGYSDPAHPGKKVYLDKYEITAGRVRAWVEWLAAQNNGEPNLKSWIAANRPQIREIRAPHRRRVRLVEVEREQPSARREHAHDFVDRDVEIGHVAQAVAGRHERHGGRRQRQGAHVADQPAQRRRTGRRRLVTRDLDHAQGEVEADGVRAAGVAARLRQRGFADVKTVPILFGLMTIHVARRSSPV